MIGSTAVPCAGFPKMKFLLTAYLAVLLLGSSAEAIEVDCFYEGDRNKISCRCVNAGRPEMVQSQDISTIISSFTSSFRRPSFSHVELRQCSSLDVILDLRYSRYSLIEAPGTR